MTITDKKALQVLKQAGCVSLDESVQGYPEDERDGRSDMEFMADEVSYFVSKYREDGNVWKEDLEEAREKLRETKNGKLIPVDQKTLKPKRGYRPSDIQIARETVDEYNRLVRVLRKLQKSGFYGRWETV